MSVGNKDEKVRVGMITIGQSPRVDVIADIEDIIGSQIEIVECGALDGLSFEEIKELKPSKDEYILVTRLRDGTVVKVCREKIIDQMNWCIKKIEDNVEVVVILCTGEFPKLKSKKLMIEPSVLIHNIVKSLHPKNRLGIVLPSSDQVDEVVQKWKFDNVDIIVETLSPYEDVQEALIKRKAERLKEASVDLIILDCIGYSTHTAKLMKKVTGIPVILPRTLIARILKELV